MGRNQLSTTTPTTTTAYLLASSDSLLRTHTRTKIDFVHTNWMCLSFGIFPLPICLKFKFNKTCFGDIAHGNSAIPESQFTQTTAQNVSGGNANDEERRSQGGGGKKCAKNGTIHLAAQNVQISLTIYRNAKNVRKHNCQKRLNDGINGT